MVASGALAIAGCGGASGGGTRVTLPADVLAMPDQMMCADASGDGCLPGQSGSSGGASASGRSSGGSSSGGATGAGASSSKNARPVPVGTDQTLPATQENDMLAVAVTGVKRLGRDPANVPARGQHYLGVQLRYRNLGLTPFEDSPDNEVAVVTDDRMEYGSALIDVRGCANGGDITVAASATLRSCVAFQLPNARKVKLVLVSLDSGTATPGLWAVP
jgi:hypothetical protein